MCVCATLGSLVNLQRVAPCLYWEEKPRLLLLSVPLVFGREGRDARGFLKTWVVQKKSLDKPPKSLNREESLKQVAHAVYRDYEQSQTSSSASRCGN